MIYDLRLPLPARCDGRGGLLTWNNLDRVDNPFKRLIAGLNLRPGDPFDRRLRTFTIALVAIVWALLAVDVWRLHLRRIESAQL